MELFNRLKKFPILNQNDFNDEELKIIADTLVMKTFYPGEIILHEGEKSHELFFLLTGTVIISKKHPDEIESFQVGSLTADHVFGDMNFIEYQTRSASIVCQDKCEVGVLSKEKLLLHSPGEKIYEKLIKKISKINIVRLKQSNVAHVKAMRKEKQQLELRVKFGKFFIIIVICFGLAGVINELVTKHQLFNLSSITFNWAYLLIVLGFTIYYIREYKFDLTALGITTKNWKPSLIESLIVSAIFLLIVQIIAFIYIHYFQGQFNYKKEYFFSARFYTYIFHSFLQEFIARGVVQTSLQRFLDDKKGYLSILMTSTLFFIFHLHQGIVTGTVVFLASLLLGWMYNRQKNLLGVTLLHVVMGMTGHFYDLIA